MQTFYDILRLIEAEMRKSNVNREEPNYHWKKH